MTSDIGMKVLVEIKEADWGDRSKFEFAVSHHSPEEIRHMVQNWYMTEALIRGLPYPAISIGIIEEHTYA